MSALVPLLIIGQALGALVGAFSAIWSEMAYLRAARDGRIDEAERRHLHSLANGLRYGMTLMLLASLGLIVEAYLEHVTRQPALTNAYWALIALALLVIGVSWALSRRRISFALGSAAAFTGWWFLAYLTLGQFPSLSFGSAVAFFVVATAVFYALLQYARFLVRPKREGDLTK